MKFAFSLFSMLCGLLLLSLFGYITNAYDTKGYCGIPAYPAQLNPFPQLKPGLELYKPQLIDYYGFVRHGDRSTGTFDCFSKTEYGNRNWTYCEQPLTSWHQGLDEREHRGTQYDIPFAPITDRQALIGTCHIGQLTQKGVLQSYNQGKRIAAFLEKAYNGRPKGTKKITEENFVLRSTDVHRTRETMIALITGAFDAFKDIKRKPKSMPTVGFIDAEFDPLVVGQKAMCIDAGVEYLASVYANESFVEYRRQFITPLNLAIKTAVNDTVQDINTMFDCAHVYQCNGWEMPPAFQPLAQQVIDGQNWFWRHVFTSNRTLSSKVMTGPLLVDLAQKFVKSALKTIYDEPTIHITTGHDIGPLMPLLLVFARDEDYYWPGYSSSLSFEFYKTQIPIHGDTSFIRFMFNEDVIIPFVCDREIVNGELCPTRVLLNFISGLFPTKSLCPTMPQFNYKAIRDEVSQSSAFSNVVNTELELAKSIVRIHDNLVENLHDDMLEQVNPVFRTLSDEITGEMTFDDVLEAFNGKLFG